MVAIKYLMFFVTAVAPLVALASFIAGFFWLGGWGWILFLWFGFTGMFSMSVAKGIRQDNAASDKGSDLGATAIIALLVLIAFVVGILFALSELPQKVSVFYALLAPFLAIALFGLFGRKKRRSS